MYFSTIASKKFTIFPVLIIKLENYQKIPWKKALTSTTTILIGRIPCECGKVYIGETKRNLPTRLKEHRAHGRRGDFEKSAIVKHSHIKDHQIDWQAAQLITPIDAWHPRRIREAIEIVKHDTVPQDIGFFISDIWRPILQTKGSSISKVHNPHQTEGSPIS